MTAFSPATESRIAEIQRGKKARDDKREKVARELAERQAKNEQEAEQRSSYSVNEAARKERAKALTDFYADAHEAKQAREQADRDKRDVRDLEALRQEFFNSSTTPFRRGMLLLYAAEIHRRLNKAPMSAEQIYELWLKRSQQDKRDEVRKRLQTVGESS